MFKRHPLYPLFFAIFPALSLTASNIGQIFVSEIARPLGFSLLLVAVVFGVAYWLIRDRDRAALGTLILLFLFFMYGRLYSAFEGQELFGLAVFRHRALAVFFGGLGLLGFLWAARKVKEPVRLRFGLNLFTAFLLIYPSITVIANVVGQTISNRSVGQVNTLTGVSQKPDVYYIILDGYGRQDVLQNEYGYDNSAFINALRERGFYIAECSQSNYAHTLFSLSSAFNYNYLDELGGTDDPKRIALLKHGTVRAAFESLGYTTVAFPTGWSMTEWTDADIYPDYGKNFTTLTEFETLFLDTTLLRVWTDYERLNSKNTAYTEARRLRVLSMLETLHDLPTRDGDYFVFAHFVVPHPPYSFGAQGELIAINVNTASREQLVSAYLNQVEFISGEIVRVVDSIQRESEAPAVIIIQGDHGPPPDLTNDPNIRMPILNAYYLPNVDAELYPSISPVNTFRVVLNAYFSANLPLLPDESFFAPNQDHERLGLVPNSCP